MKLTLRTDQQAEENDGVWFLVGVLTIGGQGRPLYFLLFVGQFDSAPASRCYCSLFRRQ
jgi:hypothetical protein